MKPRTPMNFGSVWMANASAKSGKGPASCPAAPDGQAIFAVVDTIVVGGGVFGCTTAHKQKASGPNVALIEARTVGSGTSGHSTTKLSAQQGPIYSMITQRHNEEVTKKYYDINMHGIIATTWPVILNAGATLPGPLNLRTLRRSRKSLTCATTWAFPVNAQCLTASDRTACLHWGNC